jgi:hypothetical protein
VAEDHGPSVKDDKPYERLDSQSKLSEDRAGRRCGELATCASSLTDVSLIDMSRVPARRTDSLADK